MYDLSDLLVFISDFMPLVVSIILALPVSFLAYFSYKLQKQSHNRIVEREESNYLWEIDDIFGQIKFAFTAVGDTLSQPQYMISSNMQVNDYGGRLLTLNQECFDHIKNGTSRLTNSELRRFAYIFSHASVICENRKKEYPFDKSIIDQFLDKCKLLIQDYSKELNRIDIEYDFY